VLAVPEGRLGFADEPLLEVTAPLPQAQLVETLLLNQLTFATAVASKAARCRLAAAGATLVDFSARRTHGLEAALAVARATAVVGFAGTSYVHAARLLGLTPVGTMAHSYVQAFPDETAAFRAFARDFPHATVFLVDTYDTEQGVEHAIAVAHELGLDPARTAVRLDSGDLGEQARLARGLLDACGMAEARIMASGGLDEYAIADLVRQDAPIDMYGVGTSVGVAADAPNLDSAYKMVAYDGRPVMKLSAGKVTMPSAKQVYRSRSGTLDLLGLRDEAAPQGTEPVLVPVMRGGRRVRPPDTVTQARERFERDLERLPATARTLTDPRPPTATRSVALRTLTAEVSHRLDRRAGRKT
jgi:nicotinate phosphoribosyltransferase